MVNIVSYSSILRQQGGIKKILRERYEISWMQYLIISSIARLEDTYGYGKTSEVIEELETNKAWTYKNIDVLHRSGYIEITQIENPYVANQLNLKGRSKFLLAWVERFVKGRVLE